jgi:hypothetical protein
MAAKKQHRTTANPQAATGKKLADPFAALTGDDLEG